MVSVYLNRSFYISKIHLRTEQIEREEEEGGRRRKGGGGGLEGGGGEECMVFALIFT